MSDLDFCFIGPKATEKDLKELFCDDDKFIYIKPEWTTLAHLMVEIGAFKSVSEAKRNGWDKPIPFGFTWGDQIKLPKKFFGKHIWIHNPELTDEEWYERERLEGNNVEN